MHDHPHTHDHPHARDHAGAHTHSHTLAPSREGSVVLDIGAGTGALIIETAPEYDTLEIEVSPVRDDTCRTHAAVRPRDLPGGTAFCAVITPLPVGEYTVWRDPATPAGRISVRDGEVSRVRWP
ncbi:hypothetical protein [Yinghuangia soli]|uniref:Phospholipase n=1 Tax=Yinghuangia soli TaxID=2908204 RepID=A0AA41Q9G9_9ACTN|nr:hypothetical protein [Yinghuangia soli]MCF2534040.1 hypothetical protein [Yinghuangia soli]